MKGIILLANGFEDVEMIATLDLLSSSMARAAARSTFQGEVPRSKR